LINSKGERFTNELAPRDEVSRAINEEILKGEDIFLDIRHLGEEFIEEGLPQERKLSKLYENVDPVHDLIPIRPVAHYTMGGIEVDDSSSTTVKGLFAAGECANHRVHGANRLGGNSLLEIVVFGKQAGLNAAKYAAENSSESELQEVSGSIYNLEEQQSENEIDFYEVREHIGDLFYKNVGIVRKKSELQMAQEEIKEIKLKLHLMGVSDSSKVYNSNFVEFLEFQNMLEICENVVSSALKRDESCGAHYMEDLS